MLLASSTATLAASAASDDVDEFVLVDGTLSGVDEATANAWLVSGDVESSSRMMGASTGTSSSLLPRATGLNSSLMLPMVASVVLLVIALVFSFELDAVIAPELVDAVAPELVDAIAPELEDAEAFELPLPVERELDVVAMVVLALVLGPATV